MPRKAKSRLGPPKRRRGVHSAREQTESEGAEGVDGAEQPLIVPDEPRNRIYAEARMRIYAMLAWLYDYIPIFKLEAEENAAEEVMMNCQSGYRQRQIRRGDESGQQAHDRSLLRVSSDLERLGRERRMHRIPFSQAMKSICFLVDQVSVHVHPPPPSPPPSPNPHCHPCACACAGANRPLCMCMCRCQQPIGMLSVRHAEQRRAGGPRHCSRR